MKKTIVTLFAAALMVACNKKETSDNVDHSSDHMETSAQDESATLGTDSLTTINNSASVAQLSDQDKKFADAAAKGGMMEVMAGKLAADLSTNTNVKTLGEMMVKDHTKANDELKQWASKNAYTLPAKLDADQQKKYDELKAKKGVEFDRMYTDLMVADHQITIADFKKEAAEGSETTLKNFASKALPTLEHHLMESHKAQKAVK